LVTHSTAGPKLPETEVESDLSIGNANQSRQETASSTQNLPNMSLPSESALASNAEIQRLKSLFGDAQLSWKSSGDPEIPECLRQSDPLKVEAVLTVRCGSGLAALVATFKGVNHLVSSNPALRQGLRSGWAPGFIFWVRLSSAVANWNALSQRGIEVIRSGLVPVACDPDNFRDLIDLEGPLLAFESLDLGFSIETETDGTQIPGQRASEIRTLFGEVNIKAISSLDSAIPSILKPAGSGPKRASNVLAILCEKGVGCVLSKPERLGEVENCYPVLRQATLTQWQGHYIHWVRFDPKDGPKCLLGPDRSVRLAAGALFIGQGLIPIAAGNVRLALDPPCGMMMACNQHRSFVESMMRQRIFGVRLCLNLLSVGVISVAWTSSARAAAAVYPVKVSTNNRYLVDQNNVPFLIMGDCPQSLTVNLSVAQTDSYFSNRQAHGFNTMWINLVCTSGTWAGSLIQAFNLEAGCR